MSTVSYVTGVLMRTHAFESEDFEPECERVVLLVHFFVLAHSNANVWWSHSNDSVFTITCIADLYQK